MFWITLTFLSLLIVTALLFLFLENPLTLGFILILQTFLLSLALGSMTKSFWFFYLLILIFIGGMLVLFLYVTSIFPNEKFSFVSPPLGSLLLFAALVALLLSLNHFLFITPPLTSLKLLTHTQEAASMLKTNKIFSSQTSTILIFLVNYLFYCMIVVIKITNLHQGPLRKMLYVQTHPNF